MSGPNKNIPDKQADDSLRRRDEHYRRVAEATTDAIITINSHSTILLVNRQLKRFLATQLKRCLAGS